MTAEFDDDDRQPSRNVRRQEREEDNDRIALRIQQAVERGIEKALPKFFETLGVDISNPESRADFRRDQWWVRDRRLNGMEMKKTVGSKIVGVMVGAIAGALGVVGLYVLTNLGHIISSVTK